MKTTVIQSPPEPRLCSSRAAEDGAKDLKMRNLGQTHVLHAAQLEILRPSFADPGATRLGGFGGLWMTS